MSFQIKTTVKVKNLLIKYRSLYFCKVPIPSLDLWIWNGFTYWYINGKSFIIINEITLKLTILKTNVSYKSLIHKSTDGRRERLYNRLALEPIAVKCWYEDNRVLKPKKKILNSLNQKCIYFMHLKKCFLICLSKSNSFLLKEPYLRKEDSRCFAYVLFLSPV